MTLDRLAAALVVLSGLLLLTWGGAVVAAPATLPLLYLAVRRRPSRPMRWGAAVVAGLTSVELVWALVYLFQAELRPSIWLVPLVVGLLVAVLFVTAGDQARRSSRSSSRNQISTSSRRDR